MTRELMKILKDDAVQGRIIQGVGGFYYISHEGREIRGTARGILKRDKDILYIGDIVKYEMIGDDEFVITDVIERKNFLLRPPVSNLDKLIVCFSAASPEPNMYVVDKLCVGAETRGIEVMICISKIDLADKDKLDIYISRFEDVYPVFPLSSVSGEGIEDFREAIKNSNSVLAGASGVGKSTLLNKLIGSEIAETGSISDKMKRGRHTTRSVRIYELSNGTNLYDTPGFSSLDLPEIDQYELSDYFPEMLRFKGECRYSDCMHINEPDCAVKASLESGVISRSRYDSYKKMLEEVIKWQK